jgi:hypothetical protein
LSSAIFVNSAENSIIYNSAFTPFRSSRLKPQSVENTAFSGVRSLGKLGKVVPATLPACRGAAPDPVIASTSISQVKKPPLI